jgi:hypothetical protein
MVARSSGVAALSASWLGVENRCVVPFNSFSEFNKAEGGDIWFAFDDTRPLACFAGIWTNWTSVRKVKEGETTNDLYAFLTTEPNAEVGAIHPKAMPVILTSPDEVETWVTAPADEALKLQRPRQERRRDLPHGRRRTVRVLPRATCTVRSRPYFGDRNARSGGPSRAGRMQGLTHSSDSRMIGERAVKPAYLSTECSRKKRSISLVASGPRASV